MGDVLQIRRICEIFRKNRWGRGGRKSCPNGLLWDNWFVFVHFEMELSKEYIKSLSREFRLTLMAWLVESFQEEEGESTDELIFTDELKAHLDAVDAKIKSGERKTTP